MKKQSFWQRNKKDMTVIFLAEAGVVLMAFVWIFMFYPKG